jgi:hypothetical protein
MSPEKLPDRAGKKERQMTKCTNPRCNGGRVTFTDKSGKTGTSQCPTCKGTGRVPG